MKHCATSDEAPKITKIETWNLQHIYINFPENQKLYNRVIILGSSKFLMGLKIENIFLSWGGNKDIFK